LRSLYGRVRGRRGSRSARADDGQIISITDLSSRIRATKVAAARRASHSVAVARSVISGDVGGDADEVDLVASCVRSQSSGDELQWIAAQQLRAGSKRYDVVALTELQTIDEARVRLDEQGRANLHFYGHAPRKPLKVSSIDRTVCLRITLPSSAKSVKPSGVVGGIDDRITANAILRSPPRRRHCRRIPVTVDQ
jgi:hypothetical protein